MDLNFKYLFTSFDGRINRAKYWAGTIILAIVSIVAGFIIGAIFGSSTLGAILVALVTIVFFFQAEDGIRDADVTGVQTCALPI